MVAKANTGIGERLKSLRGAFNHSQRALAAAIGTSAGHLSEIESGKKLPGSDLLCSLSRQTGVDLHWLLTGEGEMLREDARGGSSQLAAGDTTGCRELELEAARLRGQVEALELALRTVAEARPAEGFTVQAVETATRE